jgi:hypothetical protein
VKRADFEAIENRLSALGYTNPFLSQMIECEINREVKKARKEEHVKTAALQAKLDAYWASLKTADRRLLLAVRGVRKGRS